MFFPELLTPSDINNIMKDIYKNWDQDLFYNYLMDFSIDKDMRIKTFSKGMRKKLEIATALSHKPKLLILDEPFSALDEVLRKKLGEELKNKQRELNFTAIMITHDLEEAKYLSDTVITLKDGHIL